MLASDINVTLNSSVNALHVLISVFLPKYQMRGEEQFPELLRTVRKNVDPVITGTTISKMRQTRTGELLIEINGEVESPMIVREEVERSLEPNAKFRTMENSAAVKIRDLDELTTREEVLDAVLASGEAHGANIVSLRKAYGGAETAITFLPRQAVRRLCAAGRLWVNLVYARAKATELANRCYRYLAFGHTSRDCRAVDRASFCWRCSDKGHQANGCTATPQATNAFKALLAKDVKSGPHPATQPCQGHPKPALLPVWSSTVDPSDRHD